MKSKINEAIAKLKEKLEPVLAKKLLHGPQASPSTHQSKVTVGGFACQKHCFAVGSNILTIAIFALLSISCISGDTPAWPSIPHGKNSFDWARISKINGLPDFEIAASESIFPGWKDEGVLVFKNPGNIKFDFHPGALGAYDLNVGCVSGGSYAPFLVKINGLEIGIMGEEGSPIKIALSAFNIPFLWATDNVIEIIPVRSGPLALLFIDWHPTEFVKADSAVWHETDTSVLRIDDNIIKASGRCFSTYLHNPVPWSAPYFRLTSNIPCLLLAEGEEFMRSDGKSPALKQGEKFPCLTKFVIIPLSKMENFQYTLETSPLGGGRFIVRIPDFLNAGTHVDDWPRASIGNGIVTAVVTLPDPEKGFYRGPRFESAGIITSLICNGHEFVSNNFTGARNPVANDHISGPAEEFSDEIGFIEAKQGDAFLKLGVGLFEKPLAQKYGFSISYWPVKIFPWDSEVNPDRIEFRQKVSTTYGWAYDYLKRIILVPGEKKLVIEHELLNAGVKRLTSSHYSHNFFLVDRLPAGSDYGVEFGFDPVFMNHYAKSSLAQSGRTVRIKKNEPMCSSIAGCFDSQSNWARIFHAPSGSSISIKESEAPFRQALYVSPNGICPESFARIDLAPGERKIWSRTYSFSNK